MSAFVSEDLLAEIFKKLPTKTLIRFLCVWKPWKTLIDLINPLHQASQLLHSLRHASYIRLYLRVHADHTLCWRGESVTWANHLKSNLHFPFQVTLAAQDFAFVGVVRGVAFLSYSFHSHFDSNIHWNPAFRTYLALPRLPQLPLPLHSYRAIGVGYNNDGFIVVRICIPNRRAEHQEPYFPTYEVRPALEGGAWRVAIADNLSHFELIEVISTTGRFVNVSIHWLTRTQKEGDHRGLVYSVLRFDCEREELSTMQLPQVMFPKRPTMRSTIFEYGGMLSIAVQLLHGHPRHSLVEVWVMKEYGVATSWKTFYRYSDFGSMPKEHGYEESMFLMDHPKAKSYSHKGTVHLRSNHF